MTAFALPPLYDEMRAAALDLSGQEMEPALVAARFFDGLRDLGVTLPDPAAWKKSSQPMNADQWGVLELLVRVIRDSKQKTKVADLLSQDPSRSLTAFPEFTTAAAKLLTIELVLKSAFRLEELLRKWLAAMGGTIDGEQPKDSQERMERLDFGGVLKNLEAAGADREVRMKKLKALEDKRLKEQQEAYARAGRE